VWQLDSAPHRHSHVNRDTQPNQRPGGYSHFHRVASQKDLLVGWHHLAAIFDNKYTADANTRAPWRTETLRRPPGSDNMELLQFGVEPRLPRKRRSTPNP